MNKTRVSQNERFYAGNPLESTRLSSRAFRSRKQQDVRFCAACEKQFNPDASALNDLNVCADCLRIYAAVDQALNLRADRRTANLRRELMLEKWRKTNR